MKKLFTIFTMLAMALFFGSQVMAQDIQPSWFETSFDSRIYHESHGPGSSVGGWKFAVNWWTPLSNPDLSGWKDEIGNYHVEFVNTVSGDSYTTRPHYCYNTTQKIEGANTAVLSCDANVWFGNRLTVSDPSFSGSNMAVWDVYINDVKQGVSLTPVFDGRIGAFAFPEVLGGKNAMVVTPAEIKVTYTTPVIERAYLRIEVYDTNRNDVVYRQIIQQGAQKVHYVPLVYNDISLSGHYARLQMFTYPEDGPILRKSTWIKLP